MLRPNLNYNYELEASVLGVFLLEPMTFSACKSLVTEELFYRDVHRAIFGTINQLHERNYPIDLLTVSQFLYNQGITQLEGHNTAWFLANLCRDVVSGYHIETWLILLRELAVGRATIELTSGGVNRMSDPLEAMQAYERKVKKLMEFNASDDWRSAQQVEQDLLSHMQSQHDNKNIGITTGFRELDEINGLFQATQTIIVAARPGVGKSALMGMMATKMALSKRPIGIISLEMENKDIFARIVSAEEQIPFYQINRNEFFNSQDHRAALASISSIAKLPIFFSDTAKVTPSDIRAKAEKLKSKHPDLGAIFIDYIQLINPDKGSKSREQEVAELSRNLKLLAKLIKVPIIILAQLNREATKGEPRLEHLRESGSLEQDADIVMMIDRDLESTDPAISNVANLYIRKWRNGKNIKMVLGWDGDKMKFYEQPRPFENQKANSDAIKSYINSSAYQPASVKPAEGFWQDTSL